MPKAPRLPHPQNADCCLCRITSLNPMRPSEAAGGEQYDPTTAKPSIWNGLGVTPCPREDQKRKQKQRNFGPFPGQLVWAVRVWAVRVWAGCVCAGGLDVLGTGVLGLGYAWTGCACVLGLGLCVAGLGARCCPVCLVCPVCPVLPSDARCCWVCLVLPSAELNHCVVLACTEIQVQVDSRVGQIKVHGCSDVAQRKVRQRWEVPICPDRLIVSKAIWSPQWAPFSFPLLEPCD